MTVRRTGSMLMEFVITMPILLLLIMFVIQLAYLYLARECTAYAAFCATRALWSANLAEHQATELIGGTSPSRTAAERALSWFHATGLKADAKPKYSVPGWGGIPGSDTIEDHVTVDLDYALEGIDAVGKGSLSRVTVNYDCPLMIPIVGEIMALALKDEKSEKGSGTVKDGEKYPFVTLRETCVLRRPYSTQCLPLKGYK